MFKVTVTVVGKGTFGVIEVSNEYRLTQTHVPDSFHVDEIPNIVRWVRNQHSNYLLIVNPVD